METGLVVADSDLVIDFLRGRKPGRSLVRGWLASDRLRVTAITAFELLLGADFVARRGPIQGILRHRTLPLDLEAAVHAGQVYGELRSRGIGIDVRDALTAGICRRFELPLATRNLRHFRRVEGLRLAVEGS